MLRKLMLGITFREKKLVVIWKTIILIEKTKSKYQQKLGFKIVKYRLKISEKITSNSSG